jgi:hypothetical protein
MSSLLNNRVIFSDNGVLTDMSDHLNDYSGDSESFTIVSAQDAIYFSGVLPFNHRFFLLTTPNASPSLMSISVWDGKQWIATVDKLDQTLNSARDTTLAASGHVSFVLPKTKSWIAEDTDDMDGSGLETLHIYGHYWAKITFSSNCSFSLKYLGHKFSDDIDLEFYGYPDLNSSSVKTQYNNGVAKTNWDEQLITSAQTIVKELARRPLLVSADQIIRWDLFREASTHKLAEMIFLSWGKDGEEQRKVAKEYFSMAIEQQNHQLDQNANTRLDSNEFAPSLRISRNG